MQVYLDKRNLNCKQELLQRQVLEHLKDKSIREGCACICTGRAGQKHCAAIYHLFQMFSHKPKHGSHFQVSIWNLAKERKQVERVSSSFHGTEDQISLHLLSFMIPPNLGNHFWVLNKYANGQPSTALVSLSVNPSKIQTALISSFTYIIKSLVILLMDSFHSTHLPRWL